MIITLIGPLASGKGTYADLLSQKLKIPHISMGELLRQLAEKTAYGKELKKKYWGKGLLVPDDITLGILQQNLSKRGFILEGFPRSLSQAKMLDKITKIDYVVFLKVSDKTIIDRVSGRMQCMKCGAIYHIRNNPPKKDMVCDNDGTKLYVRSDDKDVKAIKKRLAIFNKSTLPLVSYYRKKGLLKEVDANGDIKKVFGLIMKAINKK